VRGEDVGALGGKKNSKLYLAKTSQIGPHCSVETLLPELFGCRNNSLTVRGINPNLCTFQKLQEIDLLTWPYENL
jgi:hypothetical protein